MANEEQVKILMQGVEVWNKWRLENLEIKPDLRGADLSNTILSRANLQGANLSRANLNDTILIGANLQGANLEGQDLTGKDFSGANLSYADLTQANLNNTILIGAYLQGANLEGQDLSGKDLSGAILADANLYKANLSDTNLSGAYLIKANLSEAYLYKANLSDANLSGAYLGRTNLSQTNLKKADLRGKDLSHTIFSDADLSDADLGNANLSRANLNRANLNRANLCGADLSGAILTNVSFQAARLMDADLDGANLTDSHLWETQRARWSIKDVICESVYWDEFVEEKTTYAAGEFERLFASQTKIKLFYKDGISPLEIATLPALIQHLSASHPGCNLRFVSINESAGGAVVELTIENTENQSSDQVKLLQEALTAEAQKLVEVQQQVLSERGERKELEGQLKELRYWFEKKLLLPTIQFNNTGQVGAMGENPIATNNTSNQIVNAENSSVGTQIQGERNIAIDGDAGDSEVITDDKSSIENE